jgi:hypothetical protein
MDAYHRHKNDLLEINNSILGLIETTKAIPELKHEGFAGWEKTCRMLPRQLEEEIMRVAVVGTIKSGKSTFLNAMLKGDYLKRGAGVVTSIVTRVHNGQRLKATLYFKPWELVNQEMEQALVLFPSLNWRTANSGFDIRNEKERHELKAALQELAGEHLISQDARNINSVLLTSYLNGYDRVKDIITDNGAIRIYENGDFGQHRNFVGSEDLAVYLRDVELEINSADFDDHIEIADCQGSDSPNPLHLAMIQDYLLMAHHLIYVVSSRTGLRQADIRFLNIIKKMGILDNTLFVINSDFSEHDSLKDLQGLVGKVSGELSLIKPEATLYCFSALYNLFSSLGNDISAKDKLRLAQWEAEVQMLEFARTESGRFHADFNQTVLRRRFKLLFQNHLERLSTLLVTLSNTADFAREILGKDSKSAQTILDRIGQHQDRLSQIKRTISSAVDGSVAQIKQEVQGDANRYLDNHSGTVMQDLRGFVESYRLSGINYQHHLTNTGFAHTVYHIFQQFKQDMDAFLTESINPAIIQFLRELEARIRHLVESVITPYEAMIADVFEDYQHLLDELGFELKTGRHEKSAYPEIDSLIRSAGLKRPSLMANLRYSAKIKTDAVMHYSAYRVVRNFKKLLKKPVAEEMAEAEKALQKALVRMKQEALESFEFVLTDYRENLKFNYLFRLVDATAASYGDIILSRFQAHFSDLTSICNSLNDTRTDKKVTRQELQDIQETAQSLSGQIAGLRREITDTA